MVGKTTREHPKTEEEQLSEAAKAAFGWQGTCYDAFTTKAPEAMMVLLDTALSVGLNADYVLFDSWFSNPAQITAIHSKGMDEMTDITFRRSLAILMDALMASLQEILKLSDKQLTAFTVDFEARLLEYLRNALHPEVAIA